MQNISIRTEHNGQLAWINMEAFNNGFGLRIRFGIEFLMRMAIPTEKTGKLKHISIFGAADDHWSTGASF